MSKPNLPLDAMAALVSGQTPSSATDRLAEILAQRLAKEQAKEDAEQKQFEALRAAQLQAVATQMAQKEALQSQCPHMKPNFQPNIGGQKDHQGSFHFVCGYCAKEFTNDLPVQLHISADRIGGPC